MRFEVETGEHRHTIDVRPSADGWTVTIDGRPISVDFARAADRWSMLVRRAERDAPASHEIVVESRGQGQRLVYVNGHAVPVRVFTGGRRRSTPGSASNASGPIAVVAPMPGRVAKVLVKAGDIVTARQGLVVVEAMKMENELRAPRAGTVAEVRVRAGAPVEANVVLVVIT